ncbi:DmpA family aminopeptidase [Jiella marina]|uniref:DmpA family aminopeptidase n=1 Tax=Jiella sp. LLJ827 TaxID=2917712 RepID=UPI002101A4EC|nr:P1 family peptidase [Jiella sp. LLJ827]MCQ0986129.1 P1 family peptidase [Jiella sp. LLJ827]
MPKFSFRARDLGLPIRGECGPLNAITDVPGVTVGATTIAEAEPRPGRRMPVLTGVTAIVPTPEPVLLRAGFHRFNGNGEMTGTHWIADSGTMTGPILITNTHGVGRVHQAAIRWMVDRHPAILDQAQPPWLMPVVAETYDGILSDINAFAVTEEHALAALQGAATGPVSEGNVGGGAGMIAYGFKGGTGTASRRMPIFGQDFMLGVLVQANHGIRDWLTVLGRPVGRLMETEEGADTERGSIIVVIATDLPLSASQLTRLARRGSIGIARGGTIGGHNSGDLFLALSTADPRPLQSQPDAFETMRALADDHIDHVYEAAVEAIEEAVLNAMLAAETVDRRPFGGPLVEALEPERFMTFFESA